MNDVVADLSRTENLPDEDGPVERVSTHCSHVFLTRHHVYKLKRAKNYGFLDYSTLEKRRHFCEEELRLNRRMAESCYLETLPVRRDRDGCSLTRDGEIVDWVVHMRRLPDECSAESRLRDGSLEASDFDDVARVLARLYRTAPAQASGSIEQNIEENFRQVAPFVGDSIEAAVLHECTSGARDWLAKNANLLSERASVDGHGDLRLEHVYLMPSGPLVIDCIEFADRYRIGDWALDVAFLAMDLRLHGRDDLADYLVGRLAYELDDYDCYPLMAGYISYRAFVRGKVACFVANDPGTPADIADRKRREARRLFDLAGACFRTGDETPRLFAIGGMIGSGKSTLARALAARGFAIVSADATRKSLAGIDHDERGAPELYTPAFDEGVQTEVLRRAGVVLESGRSVIVDTTFRTRQLRDRARELSRAAGAEFVFLECRVPESVARQRLRARVGDVSDADESLYEKFAASWQTVDELPSGEHVVVDMTGDVTDVVDGVAAVGA